MPATSTDTRWRQTLYQTLRGKAEPLVVLPQCTIPAASIWASVRLWVDVFRRHGLEPGDRVVLAVEPSIGSLAFLFAALWEELTVAIALPYRGSADLLDFFDARLGLGCGGVEADEPGCPVLPPDWTPRAAVGPATPEARLITRTSGTSGAPTWVALSDDNLWSVIDAHREHLSRPGDTVLSILPWHHSFGLVIDLLPAMLSASVIVREPSGGRDPQAIIDAARHWGATWCSMVPLQAQRLLDTPGGADMLRSLRGGVVGGAAPSAALVQFLRGTNVRVGYGQTEASPGVCLGEPGEWSVGAIGTPRGCVVRVGVDGRLLVKGPNVCMGVWERGRVRRLDPDRWLDTGDVVCAHADGRLVYLGRADHSFKLANGRMIDVPHIEHNLRTAIPGVNDAMVHSPDGEGLQVIVVMQPGAEHPQDWVVRGVLGPLGERVASVVVLGDTPDLRTGKGAIDRHRLVAG